MFPHWSSSLPPGPQNRLGIWSTYSPTTQERWVTRLYSESAVSLWSASTFIVPFRPFRPERGTEVTFLQVGDLRLWEQRLNGHKCLEATPSDTSLELWDKAAGSKLDLRFALVGPFQQKLGEGTVNVP